MQIPRDLWLWISVTVGGHLWAWAFEKRLTFMANSKLKTVRQKEFNNNFQQFRNSATEAATLRQKLHFGICLGPPSSNFQFHLPNGQALGQRVNKLILCGSPVGELV